LKATSGSAKKTMSGTLLGREVERSGSEKSELRLRLEVPHSGSNRSMGLRERLGFIWVGRDKKNVVN
jgi:hypothetical protein